MTQSWLNWGFNSSNAYERVSSCQLLMGSKWLEAENCFIWNYFCLRNFLTLKYLSSFFVSLAYFLWKSIIFSYNTSWLYFPLHLLFSVPPHLLSPLDPLCSCFSLENYWELTTKHDKNIVRWSKKNLILNKPSNPSRGKESQEQAKESETHLFSLLGVLQKYWTDNSYNI